MKLSASERYAVRAMVALAVSYGKGPLALPDIANEQRIPSRFLEHIAKQLKTAKLVQSTRGASGGYELTRPPQQISIADILRAASGSVLLLECGALGECAFADNTGQCRAKPMWEAVSKQLEVSLSEISLSDLISA